ncbi:MAG TPA: hypothetical protein VLJ80_06390 [Solirubrobacteraceae bacterium]|nr:hypothetical protein [Solirubrobacteraceae bacterium]
MRRVRIASTVIALLCVLAGCGGGSSAGLRPDARRAQRDIVAICGAGYDTALRSADSLERNVNILIGEAKRGHDPASMRAADAALRRGSPGRECGSNYADRLDIALLPRTPRQTVREAGFMGFRLGAHSYYAAHFGSGENSVQVECVTTAGGMYEDEGTLENFLYLLKTGNAQARRLLTQLRRDCRNEGF